MTTVLRKGLGAIIVVSVAPAGGSTMIPTFTPGAMVVVVDVVCADAGAENPNTVAAKTPTQVSNPTVMR